MPDGLAANVAAPAPVLENIRSIGAQLALQAEDFDAALVMSGDKLDAATIASLSQCVQVFGTCSFRMVRR